VGLLGQVQAHGAELVVVGAVGHRAPDLGLGTVATGVVRASRADVLLVRDHALGAFRRLVVGVDFSPTSLRAVERAAEWAQREGAELHIVHLFRASWRTVLFRGPSLALSSEEELQHVDLLKRRLVDFVAPAIVGLDRQKVHHDVVETMGYRDSLASYADSAAADLLVVGTRGESNLRDLFLGSTAEVCLQASRCSLLAVKPAEVLAAFGGGEGEADPRMR
jgi:nucleotide-binding universal stress UspA family protein